MSRAVAVHGTMPYKRRRDDPAFASAWKEAAVIGGELLEEEAMRRAYHGTERPVYHQGIEVGRIREYSDTLLIRLLHAHFPGKYRASTKLELGCGAMPLHHSGNVSHEPSLDAEDIAFAERLALAATAVQPGDGD